LTTKKIFIQAFRSLHVCQTCICKRGITYDAYDVIVNDFSGNT